MAKPYHNDPKVTCNILFVPQVFLCHKDIFLRHKNMLLCQKTYTCATLNPGGRVEPVDQSQSRVVHRNLALCILLGRLKSLWW